MIKKILVPLDGSSLAEKVLPQAQSLAKSEKAEIVILRVPIVPVKEFFGRDAALKTKVSREIDDESDRFVKAEIKKLKRKGAKVTGMIREGPVPETILEVADEIHADMIVMSTHGYMGLQRWLKGSVAENIVQHTHIPVMLIHPN